MFERDRGATRAELPPPPAVPHRSPAVAVPGELEERIAGRTGAPSLEARIRAPSHAVRAIVLCHPHPLYGGSMHSPVPLAIAKCLADHDDGRIAWVRFNFRGVGASEGAYGEGRGEVDDARAVIARIRAAAPAARISVCGHSFGSSVGLHAAALESGVDRALLIAPGTRFFDFDPAGRGAALEKTVFVGDLDEWCSVDEARALAGQLGANLRVFEGYDHHFLKSRRALADAALPVIAPEVCSP
jgi:alpha/beta superfamily hydrolase